jgi:hypothetical protein
MHELTPDAGMPQADLETYLQMHELSPDAGKSHEELMHILATNALCHIQIKELTCRCMNSPSDAGMSLADLGITHSCTNSPQIQEHQKQI